MATMLVKNTLEVTLKLSEQEAIYLRLFTQNSTYPDREEEPEVEAKLRASIFESLNKHETIKRGVL